MEIKYLNELPDVELYEKRNEYLTTFLEWEKTNSKIIKLSCKNAQEKNSCRSSLSAYIRKHKLDYTIYSEKGNYNIYIVRAI